MDWGTATVVLVIALAAELAAIEILRSVVDRKRKEKTGFGGTQDIAIWGTLIGLMLFVAVFITGTIWIFSL